MTCKGKSHGAISVLNAIPCGIGSTIAVDLHTEVRFETSERKEIIAVDRPNTSTSMAEICVKRTLEQIGVEEKGYRLEIETDIPPSMGLKSSSSVCNAIISAVLSAYGEKMDDLELLRLGVRCAKESKVTITGAFDDACGCFFDGLVVTENNFNEILLRKSIPSFDVILCIPERMITKDKVPVERYRQYTSRYGEMADRIENDYLSVLTENGRCVSEIVGSDCSIAENALMNGAAAAGMTGTGPAVAILAKKNRGKELAELLHCRTILTRTR